MREAAGRGVDVRVLTPGELNDVKSTIPARVRATARGRRSHLWYQFDDPREGIPRDGCWASVGTMNFDNRSLAFNDESNLLGSTMRWRDRTRCADDLTRSKEVTLRIFVGVPRNASEGLRAGWRVL
jgi:cardiolipin synthase